MVNYSSHRANKNQTPHCTSLAFSRRLFGLGKRSSRMPRHEVRYMGKLESMSQGDKRYRYRALVSISSLTATSMVPSLHVHQFYSRDLNLLLWGWRQQIPPKSWNQSTKLHGVTFHKQVWVPLCVRTVPGSNLKRGTSYNSQGLRCDPYIFHKILRTVSQDIPRPLSPIYFAICSHNYCQISPVTTYLTVINRYYKFRAKN